MGFTKSKPSHNKHKELFFHLKCLRRLSVPMARFLAAELVLALEYLHARGVIYRTLRYVLGCICVCVKRCTSRTWA